MPQDRILRDDETGPERTCVVTRRKGAPEAMIRFVVGPDGSVVPDVRRKLPGRGVWLTANAEVIEKAVLTQAFRRGFKMNVAVSPGLAAEIDALFERDALQSLAMSNKAGVVTTGFAKVEAALAAGRVAALVHAADGGDDGIRKLEAAARQATILHPAPGGPPISIKVFTSQQLDLALGRTNVIHAALAAGPASDAFLTRCRRSILYREALAHSEADVQAASV